MRVRLYGRRYCHLCDEMAQALRGLHIDFEEIDVDSDPALEEKYGRLVPLLTDPAGAEICHYHLDEAAVRRYRVSRELAELKEKAAQLPDSERAELALSLIESLDGPADEGVEEAWRLEIERRAAQIDRGEAELIPGDEVFARLRGRLG